MHSPGGIGLDLVVESTRIFGNRDFGIGDRAARGSVTVPSSVAGSRWPKTTIARKSSRTAVFSERFLDVVGTYPPDFDSRVINMLPTEARRRPRQPGTDDRGRRTADRR